MASPSDIVPSPQQLPTHQRITSHKQWVIDHKDTPSPAAAGSKQISIRPKSISHPPSTAVPPAVPAAQSASTDKETKKRLKELETAKLQMEYNTVKQENDKLKNVILKLKQEIEIYTNLITTPATTSTTNEQRERDSQRDNHPLMKNLLINTTKRRKKSDTTTKRKKSVAAPTSAADSTKPKQEETVVTSDDIMLMNTLTDVLSQME